MTEQSHWNWLDGQCLILYYWSWFDPGEGVAVGGWSQHGELDKRNSVHLAAERGQRARSLKVDPALDPTATSHTFTRLTQLPRELTESDGTPLPWIRMLLGEAPRSTEASTRGSRCPSTVDRPTPRCRPRRPPSDSRGSAGAVRGTHPPARPPGRATRPTETAPMPIRCWHDAGRAA